MNNQDYPEANELDRIIGFTRYFQQNYQALDFTEDPDDIRDFIERAYLRYLEECGYLKPIDF